MRIKTWNERKPPPDAAATRRIGTYSGVQSLECGVGFGVWGLGFGVWGLGFGVWGLECGIWGLGVRFGMWGVGCGVWGVGLRV